MTALSPKIQDRLEELCRTILAQPEFEAHRLRVDQFMINDEARTQYQRVSEQGEHLHHKQRQGVELSSEEIDAFERERDALLGNPVAKGFLEAQEALGGLQESITKYVRKTLELGRMPESDDLQGGGGCGHGCGCHHEH